VSGADGSFTITGVAPGTYTLRETGGNPAFTCTFPAGCSYSITMTSHAQVTGKDFGNAPPKVVDFGEATITGPAGCLSSTYKIKVSGKHVTKVEIHIDGKLKKTFTGTGAANQTFTYKLVTKKYKNGIHKLVATTFFTPESQTATKRMRVTFQRCAKKSIKPKFTG
jgi:hypothetical protein